MDLRDYVRVFRSHWLEIVLAVLIGGAAGFGWSALQPRVYTADASGYVTTTSADASTGAALAGDQLARAKVKSYLSIGSWRSVAQRVIDELDLDVTPERLVRQVRVTNPLDTVVIEVSADAARPEAARDLAETWLRAMVVEVQEIESAAPVGDAAAAPGAVTLIARESARLPTAPSSPHTKLNVGIGALIGLSLGLGYALVRRVFDRRLRQPGDVEEHSGESVIGSIPVEKELAAGRRVFGFGAGAASAAPFALSEAVRELRTNLQYVNVDAHPRVIVVTSPVPGDGKSTTAANLAASIAGAGEPVMLIDADMRRPVAAGLFGVSADAGLSDVLAGRASILEVAQTAGVDAGLLVLPAGRTPPNPSELLGSQRMRSLLAELSAEMMVVIDAPPTIPVTDAAILGAVADGVILVVSAGRTTFDLLDRALTNLRRTGSTVLGVVMNRVPRRGPDAARYGYRYAQVYAATQASPAKEAHGSGRARSTGHVASKRAEQATTPAPGPRRSTAVLPEPITAGLPADPARRTRRRG